MCFKICSTHLFKHMENTNEIALHETVDPFLNNLIWIPDFDSFPRSFYYPEKLPKKSILFLGLHPPKSEEKHPRVESYNQELNEVGNPYFKQFQEIAEFCNTRWAHLNLLFFRKTKHNCIDELLKKEAGVHFIWEQLKITDQIIRQIEPEIIVVNNADVRTFLGLNKTGGKNVWLGYDFVFDNAIGTYYWKRIPVFFTNLFKGQRTLDKGSFERLKWHIRHAMIVELERANKEAIDLNKDLDTRLEGLRFSTT